MQTKFDPVRAVSLKHTLPGKKPSFKSNKVDEFSMQLQKFKSLGWSDPIFPIFTRPSLLKSVLMNQPQVTHSEFSLHGSRDAVESIHGRHPEACIGRGLKMLRVDEERRSRPLR
jgi:hypothetical protein